MNRRLLARFVVGFPFFYLGGNDEAAFLSIYVVLFITMILANHAYRADLEAQGLARSYLTD